MTNGTHSEIPADPRAHGMPSALRAAARWERLADVPVLLAHPDWSSPAPVVLWMHGRTVNKELDPGRYLRWIRAGIAACAIDLPGHGERADPALQRPDRSLDVLARMVGEIDGILSDLTSRFAGAFDPSRVAIGGMSLGGMAALRRLCDPHPFRCAAVEATCGWLSELYFPTLPDNPGAVWGADHDAQRVHALDPALHLATFRPIPLLALHTQTDLAIPWLVQRAFLDTLRTHYTAAAASPDLIHVRTWTDTGAPQEHAGFGTFAAQAKDEQLRFLSAALDGA